MTVRRARKSVYTLRDIQGFAYARHSELCEGCKVIVDADFSCLEPYSTHKVYRSAYNGELFIYCNGKGYTADDPNHGPRHFLEIDKSDVDDDHLIGIYNWTWFQ